MGVLSTKMTVPRGIAVVVAILVPFWVWNVVDMVSAVSSPPICDRIQSNPLVGYVGACVVAVAPAVGLLVGWLLLRQRGGVLRTVAVVLSALGITVALVYVGISLIMLGFPPKAEFVAARNTIPEPAWPNLEPCDCASLTHDAPSPYVGVLCGVDASGDLVRMALPFVGCVFGVHYVLSSSLRSCARGRVISG